MSNNHEIEFNTSEVLPDSCQTLKSLCELTQLANMFPSSPKSWSTGIQALDNLTKLSVSTLTILASRPCMGKTDLMLKMAYHLSVAQSIKTAYFSLKNSANTLFQRLIALHEHIEFNAVQLNALEQQHAKAFAAFSHNDNLIIDDTPRLKPTELCERIRELKRQQHVEIVFIDYLQMINPYDQPNLLDEASICRILSGLSEELEIAVVLSCNLNPTLEKRESKQPTIADLIDMHIPLRYAEQIFLLHRNNLESSKQSNQNVCILYKNNTIYRL